MNITEESIVRLEQLGYIAGAISESVVETAVIRFQKNHGSLFTAGVRSYHNRDAAWDGSWGEVSEKLLFAPRDCNVPDIARDANGDEIAEARWPPSCALELEFSADFISRGMPGMTSEQTTNSILFALAQLNVMFSVVPDGTIQDAVMQEFLRLGGDVEVLIFVLATGTLAHEIMHALGGNHTPGDPDSVLYPSMRGQYILNRTDIRNFSGLGYSELKPLELKHVDWEGSNGTHVWARLGALPGSTLAWSMLSNGSCGQRAEQKYDSTVTWNKTKVNLPPVTPDDPGDPDKPTTVATFKATKADQEFRVVTGKTNGGGWEQ